MNMSLKKAALAVTTPAELCQYVQNNQFVSMEWGIAAGITNPANTQLADWAEHKVLYSPMLANCDEASEEINQAHMQAIEDNAWQSPHPFRDEAYGGFKPFQRKYSL